MTIQIPPAHPRQGTRPWWILPVALGLFGCSGEERLSGPSLPSSPPDGPTDPRIARYEGSAFQASQGARYFIWYGCQSCHRTGDRQQDLGMAPRRHGGRFADVYSFIAQGHSPDLGTQASRIPTEQLWQITAYVSMLPSLDAEKQRRQDADSVAEAQASQPPRALP